MFQNNPIPPPFFTLVSIEGMGKRKTWKLRGSSCVGSIIIQTSQSVCQSPPQFSLCKLSLYCWPDSPPVYPQVSWPTLLDDKIQVPRADRPITWLQGALSFSLHQILHYPSRIKNPFSTKMEEILSIKPTLSTSLLRHCSVYFFLSSMQGGNILLAIKTFPLISITGNEPDRQFRQEMPGGSGRHSTFPWPRECTEVVGPLINESLQ